MLNYADIKYQLLVVEDNPGDFTLLEEYLHMSKLPLEKIFHSTDMKGALKIVEENRVDLVLLDLTLPDSNGTDSVIKLDHMLSDTPIVVFSGFATIEIAMESISLGAQDYLIKGEFDERLLAKAIQYSIERKKTQKKLRKSIELYEFVNKATQDTIWEWNFNTNEGAWGDGIISIFGYTKEEIIFNTDWLSVYIHPDDMPAIKQSLEDHIKNGTTNCDAEFRFRCASGEYKDVHCRLYILYEMQAKPERMFGSLADITERKKLEKQLADQQLIQQRIITETTILAQEKERNELGRELHDNINQILATVKMYLGLIRAGRKTGEDLLGKSYEYVEEAMSEIRNLSHSLVAPSLGEMGIAEALDTLAGNTRMANGLQIQVHVEENVLQFGKDKNKELMMYRIAQEQLNNIIKHAHASHVEISLIGENNLMVLTISDDGVGFDTSQKAKGIGLKNIQSRVEFYSGKLSVISAPGKGCTLQVYIPN
ncbi:MAG: response regulator [Bacteroidetes bacterium]|nr:response regulator [Bacteroidota bacterium]